MCVDLIAMQLTTNKEVSMSYDSNSKGKLDNPILDKIMNWIGPTNVFATPPLEEFLALGPDIVPVIIDIFKHPDDIQVVREFGTNVYLPILVKVLNHYALKKNSIAGTALFDIANSKILTWGKYGKEAQSLAYELAQNILAQIQNGTFKL